MKTGPKPKQPIERFMKYVEPDKHGCWIWSGGNNTSYGVFRVGSLTDSTRKAVYAHRWIYEYVNGPIDQKLFVCHKCDVKLCVNPDHLFAGTNSENILDAVRKGIKVPHPLKGERNGRAILTAKQVLKIRALAESGNSKADLGRRFGVSASQIHLIVRRGSWAHI